MLCLFLDVGETGCNNLSFTIEGISQNTPRTYSESLKIAEVEVS